MFESVQNETNNPGDEICLTVVFKNHTVTQSFAPDLSFASFQQVIYLLSSVPITGQKLFAAKSGIIKAEKLPNGVETPLSVVFPTPKSRKRILLMGTPKKDLVDLQKAQEYYNKKRWLRRSRKKTSISRANIPRNVSSNKGKFPSSIPSIQESSYSDHISLNNTLDTDQTFGKPITEYTFNNISPLHFLHDPGKSLEILQALRNDYGISAIMKKYQWSVPVLMELDPYLNTYQHSEDRVDSGKPTHLLGLNRNKGQVIELRLRTDVYNEWLPFNDIKRVLCHELAHNLYHKHDDNFWSFCNKLEQEAFANGPSIKEEETTSKSGSSIYRDINTTRSNHIFTYDDDHRLICDEGGCIGVVCKSDTFSVSSKEQEELQKREGDERTGGDDELQKEDVKSMLLQAVLDRDHRRPDELSPSSNPTNDGASNTLSRSGSANEEKGPENTNGK